LDFVQHARLERAGIIKLDDWMTSGSMRMRCRRPHAAALEHERSSDRLKEEQ